MIEKGTIVTINDQTGVVVAIGEDLGGELGDHSGVWFGTVVDGHPELWTIPTESLTPAPEPIFKH